ncbi:unnamed protein product, partial [Rotaria magnacalcarata]
EDTHEVKPKQIPRNSSDVYPIIDLNGDIQFENVSFAYPARPSTLVLQEITLVARAGETTAFVGSSGSGKSTCISLLLRYYELSSGRITMNGQSIADCNEKELRKHIGVVGQEPVLFGTTIYENIRYGQVHATKDDIEQAAKQANAHDFIMNLPQKYETIVGEQSVQLSGGEKQRIALARALVKKPNLLLLDEPTSALDNAGEKLVQEALDSSCAGRTTIVIAHRLKTIQNAHHIYVFANGNIIEEGTHTTLMAQKNSKYRLMVDAQQTESTQAEVNERIDEVELEQRQNQKYEDSRSFNKNETIDAHANKMLASSTPFSQSIFLRLLFMNKQEWIPILIACIACLISGATQSLTVVLLEKTMNAKCTYEKRRHGVLSLSYWFVVLGIGVLAARVIQHTAFAVSGSKLTQKLRAKAFAQLLRQEMAYFDLSENHSGSISNRLSSEALSIQELLGARLGVICEAMATLGFGILLGFVFSWELTLIVFAYIICMFLLAFFQIRWQARLNKCSEHILGQASALAAEVLHNMRTVKQLSIEYEILQQFSHLVNQAFTVRRNDTVISGLLLSIYWGSQPFFLYILYWIVFVRLESNEMHDKDTLMYI